jgi:hypothetical protein
MQAGNKFLPKHLLMQKLEEYENLMNAMSALTFVSRQITHHIPCVFQALREFAIEQRAGKIQDILSSAEASVTLYSGPVGVSQIVGESDANGTETEEYFENADVEEYMQVKDS